MRVYGRVVKGVPCLVTIVENCHYAVSMRNGDLVEVWKEV